jgi:hypothetical protein
VNNQTWAELGITCSFHFRCASGIYKKLKRVLGRKKYQVHFRGGRTSESFSGIVGYFNFDDQKICDDFISVYEKAISPGNGEKIKSHGGNHDH